MKTRITEMLGIKHPIFQGSMAWVAFPPLVAAVSNAGGLGILTGSLYSPEELARQIRATRALTDKPFAVNFTPSALDIEALLEVCIQEKVAAITYGRADAATITAKVRPHGILSFPVVPTVKAAQRAEADGADAIIASGYEAGGHVGRIATMALIPQVVDKVKVPVIAAGGLGDARGLVAALALGAEGIQMGTRFLCTRESPAHPAIKQRLLAATEEETLITGHITGIRCRVLKNKLTELFQDLEDRKAPLQEFDRAGLGKGRAAFVEGDVEGGSIWCGQIVGLVHDIPTCQELLDRIVAEAETILGRLHSRILPASERAKT